MADRAEVTKVVGYVTVGTEDVASASKVVAYLVIEPGEGGEAATGQSYCFINRITKPD